MNLLKRNFIKSFADEIANLNGTEFEYLCRPLLSIILKDEVEHKGHNLYGKPVGYTADFLADNYEVVGQCGTEPNYFDDLSKPIMDISKAIKNHPQCETVYLFANQRGTGSRLTSLDDKIKGKNFNKTAIVYDSEKSANDVLDNINATVKIEVILSYLPKTRELYKILPESNKLPALKSQYYERDDEKEILGQLEFHNYIQIFGVSGIGKTELSISIANHLKGDFETIIWLDGESVEKENFNLSSVLISKFNSTINVEFLLQRHKTLLVVDNLNEGVQAFVDQFKVNNKTGSKCIITSLQRNLAPSKSYNLDFLNSDIARKILFTCTPKPSEKVVQVILNTVHGYPLVLMLIKSAVEMDEFSWDDIVNEIELLKDFTDDKNEKLSDRIIGKFLDTLNKELTLINILNKRKLSRHFIKYVIGKTGVTALEKRSLINVQDSYYFSIHQLILDAIREKTNSNDHADIYESKLFEYLQKYNEIKSIEYYNFLLNHREFVEDIYKKLPKNSDLKKAILYALIQSSNFFSQPDWVNTELEQFSFSPSENYQDLLLFIEQQEIRLFQLKPDSEEYINTCDEIIASMEALLSKAEDQKIKKVLLHHTGKFHAKKKDLTNAEKYFVKVLEIDKDADYSILQLARINVKNKEFKKAASRINMVLDREIDLEQQSLAILLSFYELIAHPKLQKLRTSHIDNNTDFFLKVLLSSLDAKFDHPYRVLEKLSSHLAYLTPEVFRAIYEMLPFPSNVESSNQLKLAYATINLAYYKLLKFSKEELLERDKKMQEAFLISEQYYLAASLENDLNRKKLLDLYIQSNEIEKAINLLQTFDDKQSSFFLQNECKVFRLNGDFSKALNSINEAIKNQKEVAAFYKAAFLNDKAETLKAMENPECIAVLEEAISSQTTSKTIEVWSKKLKEWKNETN